MTGAVHAPADAAPTGPAPSTQDPARETLRRHGRSFHFAAKFLGQRHADQGARLYAFCRYIDDLADESPDPRVAASALRSVRDDLDRAASDDPVVAQFLKFAEHTRLDLRTAHALLDGVESDFGPVRLANEAELIGYAYHVAGVVGLMMCAALDVDDPKAATFAIDMGVAMQLTNIARDVLEDAQAGRVYLPARWTGGASPADITARAPEIRPLIAQATGRILGLAERYYASSERGLGFLPARARFAILVASRVYRKIGRKLRRRRCDIWAGRVVVTGGEKLLVAAGAAVDYMTKSHLHTRETPHDAALHRAIADLPGAHHG